MATTWADSAEDRYGDDDELDKATLKERFVESRTAIEFVRLVMTTLLAIASVWTLIQGAL